jgi:uncharacterized protein (DUF952 family)
MPALFHIIDAAEWAAVVGEYRPPSLAEQGFVHLSFADQVAGTANRFYGGAENLVVLEVDPDALPDEVRLEDSYGAGILFPHLYGPLPAVAVVAVHPVARTTDGRFTFDAGGRASSDR